MQFYKNNMETDSDNTMVENIKLYNIMIIVTQTIFKDDFYGGYISFILLLLILYYYISFRLQLCQLYTK